MLNSINGERGEIDSMVLTGLFHLRGFHDSLMRKKYSGQGCALQRADKNVLVKSFIYMECSWSVYFLILITIIVLSK